MTEPSGVESDGQSHAIKTDELQKHMSLKSLLQQDSSIFLITYLTYLFSFVYNLLMARWLGPVDFGSISFVLRIFGILIPLLAFGVDGVLVKHMQYFLFTKNYSHVNGMLRWSIRIFLLATAAYLLVSFLVVWMGAYLPLNHRFEIEIGIFAKGLWLPPFLTFMYLQSAMLRSLQDYYAAKFFAWASTVVISTFIMLYFHYTTGSLGVWGIFMSMAVAAWISIACQLGIILKQLPSASYVAKPAYDHAEWMPLARNIVLSNTFSTVSIVVTMVLINLFCHIKEEVAYFFVCFTIAQVYIMLTQATTLLIGPWVTMLQKQKKFAELQWLLGITTYFKIGAGLFFSVIIIIGGRTILLWFGHHYDHLYWPMLLLSAFYFIAIIYGSAPAILQYAGYARLVSQMRVYQILILVVLGVLLIGHYNSYGVVVANGASLVAFELLCNLYVRKHLKLSLFNLR